MKSLQALAASILPLVAANAIPWRPIEEPSQAYARPKRTAAPEAAEVTARADCPNGLFVYPPALAPGQYCGGRDWGSCNTIVS